MTFSSTHFDFYTVIYISPIYTFALVNVHTELTVLLPNPSIQCVNYSMEFEKRRR
jgi:hypothetical protein